MIPGDPAPVRAAARTVGRGGTDLEDCRQAVGRHAADVLAAWEGSAADAAVATAEALGTRLLNGALAAKSVERVYLLYADALEEAQHDFAAGQLQADRGRSAQRAAATNALRADAPLLDTSALARLDAAATAHRHATEEVVAGEAAMVAAVDLERRANRAAADALAALATQVDLMALDGERPTTVPSAVPAVAALTATVAELARDPVPLHEQRRRDARAGYREGLLDVTVGTLTGLAAIHPSASTRQGARVVEDAVEDWQAERHADEGVDTSSASYRRAESTVHVVSAATGVAGAARAGVRVAGWAASRLAGRTADDLSGAATPGASVPGTAFRTPQDVLANPELLRGRTPAEVEALIGDTPGWEVGVMRHGRSRGSGWTLREMNAQGTDYTGRFIQWSPGSPRHAQGMPYWKVTSGEAGKVWIEP